MKKSPNTNTNKGLCPETTTTEDYELVRDVEWNKQIQVFYSGAYSYDDKKIFAQNRRRLGFCSLSINYSIFGRANQDDARRIIW